MSIATTTFQSLRKPTMPQASPPMAGLSGLLQRKCACGSPAASLTGQCEECKSKGRLQAKLTIGASDDPLEQEADRVADQVLAAGADPAAGHVPPRIQRYTAQATEGMDTAPASVDRVLASSGRPLEPALKQDMEQRFGHDFSRVRIHYGTEAEQSTRDVNAHAYTVGHNIVFGSGQFVPGTGEGRRLIAHELTHVVQQFGSGVTHGERKRDLSPVSSQTKQLYASTLHRRVVPATEANEILSSQTPETGIGNQGDIMPASPPRAAPIPQPETCPPPEEMNCPPATSSPGAITNTLIFPQNIATLSAMQQVEVDAVAASWHAADGSVTVRVDGYASAEGECGYNWGLSCRRAEAVAAELVSPSDGSPGVPAGRLNMFAHGESGEAGRALAHNRMATISMPAAPPGPMPPIPPAPAPALFPPSISFWINAFIPITTPGVIVVPTGPFAGRHFFPGPPAPFHLNSCFETDERMFITSPAAAAGNSRIHLNGTLNTAIPALLTSFSVPGVTDEIDCTTGVPKCHRGTSFTTTVSLLGEVRNRIFLLVSAAGNDPCVTGSPDLSVHGVITVNRLARTLSFEGITTGFPAFEMYADFGSGPTTVFIRPPIINSVAGLFIVFPVSATVPF